MKGRNPKLPYGRWPQSVPLPAPIHQTWWPVANAQAIDTPQAQFAKPFLPPGSGSVTPFSYTDWDHPCQPNYTFASNTFGGSFPDIGLGSVSAPVKALIASFLVLYLVS